VQIHSRAHNDEQEVGAVDENTTLSDDEIQTTSPGESRSRWSVTDADQDDTDTTDADDADSDSDADTDDN
jgi:hypothetical protein